MKSIINIKPNDINRDTGFPRTVEDLFYSNFFENENDMIKEMPNYYHLSIPVPGMSKKDLTLRLEDQMLIVEGHRKSELHKNQIHSASLANYRRSMQLPIEADTNQIKAKLKNGLLSIKIFKEKQHDHKRLIPVRGEENSFLTKNNIWYNKLVQNLTNSFRNIFN